MSATLIYVSRDVATIKAVSAVIASTDTSYHLTDACV